MLYKSKGNSPRQPSEEFFALHFLVRTHINLNTFAMRKNENKKKRLTTASGKPYVEHEDTMSVGPRGPLLLQDYILHEKMAHFNRERIPERVVHAKGSGAFGTFTVTND